MALLSPSDASASTCSRIRFLVDSFKIPENGLSAGSSDITLIKDDLRLVGDAMRLSKLTMTVIRQNLFWAFFYNSLGVPLAALGFMSPILCAAAMGLSDLVVIGNALRLRTWRL